MKLQYFTDSEYEQAFIKFGDLRGKIADRMEKLSSFEEGTILDFLSGHGLLAAELAMRFPRFRILGIGLENDVTSWKGIRESNKYPQHVWSQFHYLLCNAIRLPLKSLSCDMVVNFLGLEDLHMTTGRDGLINAVSEINRVTTRESLIQISLVEYGDSPEEQLSKEVWNEIGLNAVFLEREKYLDLFSRLGIHPLEEFSMKFDRKMTGEQAREELMFACEEAPRIFSTFDVRAVPFNALWQKFGDRIMEHGLSYWSQIRVIILSKDKK